MATIFHRERADGVEVRLQAFLDWWMVNGPFDLMVLKDGGVRTDAAAQMAFFNAGRSKAMTLDQTPHGRAGALDVAPYINGAVPWLDWSLFERMGVLAESQGFVWGGRWTSPRDGDHIECADWRTLPYPPQCLEEVTAS